MLASFLFPRVPDQTILDKEESAQVATPDVPQKLEHSRPINGDPWSQTVKAVYVATNLDAWLSDEPAIWNGDIERNGIIYRQLDPMYYVWLRQRMVKVKEAHGVGKIGTEAYEMLRSKFNLVHAWAIGLFGKEELKLSWQKFQSRANRYQPPSRQWLIDIGVLDFGLDESDDEADKKESPEYLFPVEGSWVCTAPVVNSAVIKVDAIKELALVLGWSMERLYQNRGRMAFPYGDEYGLVCFLCSEDRIGNVTKEAIEIVKRAPWYNRMLFKREALDWNQGPTPNDF